MDSVAFGRVRALVEAAREIADRASVLGRRARAELPTSTGLSSEGVELALAECLETAPSRAELEALVRAVTPTPRAHVLLSSNVFTATHRALALALAGSAVVSVRPSRREPVMTRLLADADPDLFEISDELSPAPGDALWAYGSDETLAAVRGALPAGVAFYGHGHGFGVAVVAAERASCETARDLARDMVVFDQRGCLSPRVAFFEGAAGEARAFAELLAGELEHLEQAVPLGRLEADEAADVTRFRDAQTVATDVFAAGRGFVSGGAVGGLVLGPVGRNLHVEACDDASLRLAPHARHVAALGLALAPERAGALARALPGARLSPLGVMQRPPFDGPVDRRSGG